MATWAPSAAQNISPEIESKLQSDAAHAWQYFERKSKAMTGLASPNIWSDGDGEYASYDRVTMWDVGSIVFATLSARSLGLIDEAAFDARVRGILDFLNRAIFKY
jgi:hypothetical protein